jgi:hypothetical protein
MAEVFVARRQGAEGTYKILVLKRILPAHGASRRFRSMFVEEAQLATRLNHPNIVQVYEFQDYGEEGLLLSMEFVEGLDLGKLMSAAKAKATRVPPWVSAYIVSEVGKGLHYAHERKEGGTPLDIVHRDVSPQNVLLSYDGAVKIADFGIATANLFRDETGVLKGKYGYMSPEQARGEKVDRRGDIYALGVVLHELLTGRPLHGNLTGDSLLEAVRAGVVEPPSTFARDVPRELEALVMRALAKSAEDRFQSARDMSAAISRALFQKQEYVDAAAVEATIARLAPRHEAVTGSQHPSAVGDSLAHAAMGATGLPRLPTGPPTPPEQTGQTGEEGAAKKPPPRPAREVRHVAVLTLKLQGFKTLERWVGPSGVSRAADKIRATLDDIAYKRGARFAWEGNESARALVGLMANPARAAADAAWLALDAHEALAGASEDLVTPIRSSIGIVRGVATGSAIGETSSTIAAEPAHVLSTWSGSARRPGPWVAGGLYRLLRREFRWGMRRPSSSAPRAAKSAEFDEVMRSGATREARAELALAHDLVGREAGKADLLRLSRALRAGNRVAPSSARWVSAKTALVATFLSGPRRGGVCVGAHRHGRSSLRHRERVRARSSRRGADRRWPRKKHVAMMQDHRHRQRGQMQPLPGRARHGPALGLRGRRGRLPPQIDLHRCPLPVGDARQPAAGGGRYRRFAMGRSGRPRAADAAVEAPRPAPHPRHFREPPRRQGRIGDFGNRPHRAEGAASRRAAAPRAVAARGVGAFRKCSPTWSPRWRAIRSFFWRWWMRSSSGGRWRSAKRAMDNTPSSGSSAPENEASRSRRPSSSSLPTVCKNYPPSSIWLSIGWPSPAAR